MTKTIPTKKMIIDSDVVLRKIFAKDMTKSMPTKRWLSNEVNLSNVTMTRLKTVGAPKVIGMVVAGLKKIDLTIEDIFEIDERGCLIFHLQKLLNSSPEFDKISETRLWVTKLFSDMSLGTLYNWESGDVPHIFYCILKMKQLSGCDLNEFLIEKL